MKLLEKKKQVKAKRCYFRTTFHLRCFPGFRTRLRLTYFFIQLRYFWYNRHLFTQFEIYFRHANLTFLCWNLVSLFIIHSEQFRFIRNSIIWNARWHLLYQEIESLSFPIDISWLVSHEVCIHVQYFFDVVRNKLELLNVLIKRRSKVHEKNMSCERTSIFHQWKTFSENYKPMRVWFWLVYKFTENFCPSWLFSEFIQTQKRYPTSLDKIPTLTWKLLVIWS